MRGAYPGAMFFPIFLITQWLKGCSLDFLGVGLESLYGKKCVFVRGFFWHVHKMFSQFHLKIGHDDRTSHQLIMSTYLEVSFS